MCNPERRAERLAARGYGSDDTDSGISPMPFQLLRGPQSPRFNETEGNADGTNSAVDRARRGRSRLRIKLADGARQTMSGLNIPT